MDNYEALTRQKLEAELYRRRVNEYVERVYGDTMSRHHRHILRSMVCGEYYTKPRPHIYRMLRILAGKIIRDLSPS